MKEGTNRMNKYAVIRTQALKYFKLLVGFIIGYAILMAGSYVVIDVLGVSKQLDGVSYLLGIYLFLTTWLLMTFSMTFYTYHSFSRQRIISGTMIVQLVVSLLGSLFLEGHNLLLKYVPQIHFAKEEMSIRTVYTNQLSSNELVRMITSLLFVTLLLFFVCQIANMLAILTYSASRKRLMIVLILVFIVIAGIFASISYWNTSMISLAITILGFVTGTGQSMVPRIVIPFVMLVSLTLISMVVTVIKGKTLEIQKNSLF